MKKKKRIIFIVILFINFSLISIAQTPFNNDPNWSQIWEDEFSLTYLDSIKWHQVSDWRNLSWRKINSSPYDHDLNAFRTTNDNISFRPNGEHKLRIITKKENVSKSVRNEFTGLDECHTFNYTTAKWLMSNQRFKYGYFEIKCQLPQLTANQNNKGIGANFWLWHHNYPGENVCWSEIDIFEFKSPPNLGSHNYTMAAHSEKCDTDAHHYTTDYNFGSIDFATPHIFAVAWYPSRIDYFIDNNLIYSISENTSPNFPLSVIQDLQPMPLILDVNVFTDAETPDDNTLFPYNYDIDYIKVYALNTSKCYNTYNNCDLNTYENSIYDNIIIGGSCNPTIINGQNKFLRAVNGITINGGFTIELGATFAAETKMECHTQEVTSQPITNNDFATDCP